MARKNIFLWPIAAILTRRIPVMARIILIVSIILCWPLAAHAWVAKVISVTDGDTVRVYSKEQGLVKIRFFGIDAPEKRQPYGRSAKKYLTSIISGARVEVKPITKDSNGRTVAVVLSSEANVNLKMVRAGYAWVYRRYCDKPFCAEWIAIEAKARAEKSGLWKEKNPVPPWEWRRMRR